MATVELTKDNIESTINDNNIVVIDFWAPWCGPCKSFGPVFKAASEKHTDLVFGKINTDEEQELAGSFGISGIPTLVIFRENIGIFKQAGMLPAAEFDKLIAQIKEMDMDDVRKQIAEQEAAAGGDGKADAEPETKE